MANYLREGRNLVVAWFVTAAMIKGPEGPSERCEVWNDSMHGPQVVTEQVFALGRTCCCGRIMLAVRASSNARSEAGFSTKARNAWGCVAICFATSAAQSSRQVFWPHSRERLRSVLVFYVVPPVNIPLRPQLSASSLMF